MMKNKNLKIVNNTLENAMQNVTILSAQKELEYLKIEFETLKELLINKNIFTSEEFEELYEKKLELPNKIEMIDSLLKRNKDIIDLSSTFIEKYGETRNE